MGLYKIFKILAALIGVIAIVFFVMILAKGTPEIEATGEGVDGPLYFGYLVLGLITLLVLFFALKGIFAGDIKKTLLTIVGFVVIIGIAYGLAGSEVLPAYETAGPVTDSTSKWVGTGINAFYITALVAIVVTVFGGVRKITSR